MKRIVLALLFISAATSLEARDAIMTEEPDTPAESWSNPIPEGPGAVSLSLAGNTDREIMGMLELLGARAWRFDTGGLSGKRYSFTPFFEEYVAGQMVEQDEESFIITMTQDWRDRPSDSGEWGRLVAEKNPRLSDDGEKYLVPLEGVGVFVAPRSDSAAVVRVDLYGLGAMSSGLKFRPLDNGGETSRYAYAYHPFKIEPLKSGPGSQRVPLLLAGSFWWDEKAEIHRFCTVKEFAPDMSDKELGSIPHYYVIGIEIEEIVE